MAQIFHRSTNTISRASIFGAVFLIGLALWIFYDLEASPYTTQQNVAREQPIQFSHAHHAGAIGIDCRYCHTSVEKDRKSTRLNSSHGSISYAVFCLKKNKSTDYARDILLSPAQGLTRSVSKQTS